MVDENSQQGRKKDWGLAESVLGSMKLPQAEPTQGVRPSERALVPQESSAIPAPLIIAPPDTSASLGIVAMWKAKQMGRKAALTALEEQYNGQLELLKHVVTEQVKVGKTRVSVAAEEYLNKLDAKHMEVLAQLGMRNAATRWKAVTDLTDMALAQVREVEGKDWPEPLIKDTVGKVFELRERVATKIMRELGSEYAKD